MSAHRGWLWSAIALLMALPALPVKSQTTAATIAELERPVVLEPLRWLPPGANATAALTQLPPRQLEIEIAGGHLSLSARLGELAFGAPQVFGGIARKSRLSCQTCHSNGHINRTFFVPGLSSRPGNFDTSNALFNSAIDDGVLNDRNIPSLRGVALTAPYGHDGRFASLREFTRHVIVEEFRGPEPAPWLLDALVAFQQQIAFLPAPAGTADEVAVRRGEAVFRRPFPRAPSLSCAACHPADVGFTDRRLHDVGTNGLFDTPTLRNVTVSAPYFHDGRAPDLASVVAHFDRHFELALDPAEQADLVAYLEAIGGAVGEPDRPSLDGALTSFAARLDLVADAIEREDAERLDFISRALRHQLGEVHDRLPGASLAAQREVLIDWSRQMAAIAADLARRDDAAAREKLTILRRDVQQRRSSVAAVQELSLYDVGRLRQRLVD